MVEPSGRGHSPDAMPEWKDRKEVEKTKRWREWRQDGAGKEGVEGVENVTSRWGVPPRFEEFDPMMEAGTQGEQSRLALLFSFLFLVTLY